MRFNHHWPSTPITSAATRLACQPAQGEVCRYLIGIQFWISGEPAAVMVMVMEPKPSAAGMKRRGRSAARNRLSAVGYTENATTNRLTPP